jgi:hypothetical protein
MDCTVALIPDGLPWVVYVGSGDDHIYAFGLPN